LSRGCCPTHPLGPGSAISPCVLWVCGEHKS
jgi:hypothetical protein